MNLNGLERLYSAISSVTDIVLQFFLAATFIIFLITGLKSVFGDWKASRKLAGALLMNAAAVFILVLLKLRDYTGGISESGIGLGISAPMLSAAGCAAAVAASIEYFLVVSLGRRWRFRKPCQAVFGLCGTVADTGILGFEHVKEPFLGYRYRFENRNYISEPHPQPRLKRSQVGEKVSLMIDPVCPEFFLTSAEMKLGMAIPLCTGVAAVILLFVNLALTGA